MIKLLHFVYVLRAVRYVSRSLRNNIYLNEVVNSVFIAPPNVKSWTGKCIRNNAVRTTHIYRFILLKEPLSTGKTDRIDLATFHPFLVCLAEISHMSQVTPVHSAFTRTIDDLDSLPSDLPDGSAARLILLCDTMSSVDLGSERWYPTAVSDKARSKLLRRIRREGHILPIVISTCLALLAEMYSTTTVSASDSPDGKLKRRTRLRYRSSPLSTSGLRKVQQLSQIKTSLPTSTL